MRDVIDEDECCSLIAARINQLIEWEGLTGPVALSLATAGRKSAVALSLAEQHVRKSLLSRLPTGSRLKWSASSVRLQCTVADEVVIIHIAPLASPLALSGAS